MFLYSHTTPKRKVKKKTLSAKFITINWFCLIYNAESEFTLYM